MTRSKLDSIKNPGVKIGDKIILLESRNSSSAAVNKELTVINGGGNMGTRRKSNFQARDKTGRTYNIFYTGPADTFIMSERKNILAFKKLRVDEIAEERKKLEKEIEHLEKYPTHEDYVSDKLCGILDAHAKSKDKKKVVTDLLKAMKEEEVIAV